MKDRLKSLRAKSWPIRIMMVLGFLIFIASLVFGGLKFYDVFYSNNPDDTPTEQINDVDIQPEQQPQVQEEPKEEKKEETKKPTPKPKPTVKKEQPGPLENVGTVKWVVNKRRPLNPKTYVPPNLRQPNVKHRVGGATAKVRSDVASAVEKLFAGAKDAGLKPMFSSGYRSYSYQTSLYNSYVNSYGRAKADTFSARPGYSEHQTGLSFDICNETNCSLQESFANTSLGKWVAKNAHKYGFVIRYPKGKQSITGYTYEPWHLRYVGTSSAASIYGSGETLEQYFNLPAAPDYLD